MPDLVYPPVIAACKTMFKVLDLRLNVEGSHHVPRTGGAVLAATTSATSTSSSAGSAPPDSKRLVRFMAKQEVFANQIAGPLMRGMKHIPVDREAGTASYNAALRRAQARRGRRRLPGGDDQPVVHRQGPQERHRPDGRRGRRADPAGGGLGHPAALDQGPAEEPDPPPHPDHHPDRRADGSPGSTGRRGDHRGAAVEAWSALVARAQQEYRTSRSAEDGWWLPAHLGGSAPTPEEAGRARTGASRRRKKKSELSEAAVGARRLVGPRSISILPMHKRSLRLRRTLAGADHRRVGRLPAAARPPNRRRPWLRLGRPGHDRSPGSTPSPSATEAETACRHPTVPPKRPGPVLHSCPRRPPTTGSRWMPRPAELCFTEKNRYEYTVEHPG